MADIVSELRDSAYSGKVPNSLSVQAAGEIERLKKIIENYAKITAASSREINGLLAINESLRREVREQRKEIAALREERRAVIESDRPWKNENPEGGWIT